MCSQALTRHNNTVNSKTNCLAAILKPHKCNLSHQHHAITAVAIQCLETTFKIGSSDCHLAVPQPLTEIFLNSLLKVGTAPSMEPMLSHTKKVNQFIIMYGSYELSNSAYTAAR